MTKDAFSKFFSKVEKNYYHNQYALKRIKEIYCLKRRFTTVKYSVVVNNRICYTWRDCKRELSQIPPEYIINISLPFVNRDNDYIYYVSLTKTINLHGNNSQHSLAWTLFRFIQASQAKTKCRKEQISLRRIFKENGISFD